MVPTSTTSKCIRQHGFSLLEMAVVLLILGILLSGVLLGVSQSTENTRRTLARDQLRQIQDALYGYAQITGYLPCPADADTAGQSDPLGPGNCNLNHGFVPAATLGFFGAVDEDGLLTDPWGNPYRYSLSDFEHNLGFQTFSSATEVTDLYNDNAVPVTGLLRVCDNANCTGNILTDIAPAIVFSMGENWAAYSSNDEIQNAGDGTSTLGNHNVTTTSVFVNATYSQDQFDDILVWLSPHLLFNKMITAGRLP